MNHFQDLSRFKLPPSFRGKSALWVQLWWVVQSTLFRWSPQFAYGWRRAILRAFGAEIGKDVLIRPTVEITYPWKVYVGDYSWIGDNATLYSLGRIFIGAHCVVSQKSYICAGDHDPESIDFAIRGRDIKIEDEVWIATDVFVAPGVRVGTGSIIGARSSVFSDMPPSTICMGSPCIPARTRRRALRIDDFA